VPVALLVLRAVLLQDWHFREAATFAFGAVMDGPEVATLDPYARQALAFLVNALKDQDRIVRVRAGAHARAHSAIPAGIGTAASAARWACVVRAWLLRRRTLGVGWRLVGLSAPGWTKPCNPSCPCPPGNHGLVAGPGVRARARLRAAGGTAAGEGAPPLTPSQLRAARPPGSQHCAGRAQTHMPPGKVCGCPASRAWPGPRVALRALRLARRCCPGC
jgi:hypothetical protein